MDVDQVNTKSAPSRPARLSTIGKSYVYESDDGEVDIPNLAPIRLIGRRLCVNGFIYIRNQMKDDGRTTWECGRYRTRNCRGKAYTNDPFVSNEIIVYRETPHDHPPSEHEVEEAERGAKKMRKAEPWKPRKKPKPKNAVHTSSKKIPQKSLPSTSTTNESTHPPKVEHSAKKAVENNCTKQKDSKKLESEIKLTAGAETSSCPPSVKLIGNRLCIDGYVYLVHEKFDNRVAWRCRRRRSPTNRCLARATTSKFMDGEEPIVKSGPKESKHNHPPILEDIEEAKRFEQFGRHAAKRNRKVTSRTRAQPKAQLLPIHKHESNSKPSLENSNVSKKQRQESVTSHRHGNTFRSLLNDSCNYRCFLLKFLENPIFDRKSIIAALSSVYKSLNGCLMAYGTILENKDKIQSDIEALKKDSEANITALNDSVSCRTVGNVKVENDSDQKPIDLNNCKAEAATEISQSSLLQGNNSEPTSVLPSTQLVSKGKRPSSPSSSVSDSSEDESDAEQGIEGRSLSPKKPKIAKEIPPVPGAIPLKHLVEAEQPVSSVNFSKEEAKVKQELPIISSTGFNKVTQECSTNNEQQMLWATMQKNMLAYFQGVPTIPFMLDATKTQTMDSVSCTKSSGGNPLIFNPQDQLHNQHTPLLANMIEGVGYTSAMLGPFNYSPGDFNFTQPYLMGHLQIPFSMNVTSVGNDGVSSTTNQLHTPILLHHPTNHDHGHKS
ncbi:hypothetical protein QAD02_006742 [Eretmocerus hayati]|uniref:Uncharacterized protein n=1 Tax=Eretmocerus hayati TaxID=131215 RepID=A0ACC2N1R0_9HYME|nr:hypothetical protein QAD02_006742 [Eretmocerus hayati]